MLIPTKVVTTTTMPDGISIINSIIIIILTALFAISTILLFYSLSKSNDKNEKNNNIFYNLSFISYFLLFISAIYFNKDFLLKVLTNSRQIIFFTIPNIIVIVISLIILFLFLKKNKDTQNILIKGTYFTINLISLNLLITGGSLTGISTYRDDVYASDDGSGNTILIFNIIIKIILSLLLLIVTFKKENKLKLKWLFTIINIIIILLIPIVQYYVNGIMGLQIFLSWFYLP